MASFIGRGHTIRLKVDFFLYDDGPLYDPFDDGAHPELTILYNDVVQYGPLLYESGTGAIVRDSLGVYYYDFDVPANAGLGIWIARWESDSTTIGDEEFLVVQVNEVANPAIELLRAPTLKASMRESSLYQTLGVGFTDPIFLIGHADGLELNDPYRVSSIQEAITAMQGNSSSPLLRSMLELYYAGSRDIYLIAAAPMSEYVDSLPDRLIPKEALGALTFYERYYQRLNDTYEILKEWDVGDIIIPTEAVFYDAGGVDFATQLIDHCQDFFDLSGKIRMGLLGTRDALSDDFVAELLSDDRLTLFPAGGKFVSIIVGDGIVNNREIPVTYSTSVVASVAGMLSQLSLDRGITYMPIPNIVNIVGKDLSDDQIMSLALKKLNVVSKTSLAKRGQAFGVVVVSDNTLGLDGSDFWSMLQMRLITKIIERVRVLGRNYIGSVGFADFKSDVENYMLALVTNNKVRDFTLQILRDPLNSTRATVEISVRPYFGIREVFAAIEVGPSISLGTVRQ